jgi:uncharacterized protein involved in exopolysaccharide biosynthesis
MTDNQNQESLDGRQEINWLEMTMLLVKRKTLVIKVCCIAVAASVIYSLTLHNIYTATAKVLPPQKESAGGLSALISQAGGLSGLAAGGFGGGSDLYLGILKSRSVADAVIQQLDLVKIYKVPTIEAARINLAVAVKVQAGKDGIISISAEDKDPKLSALLANTYVDELGKATVRLNLSKAGAERLFLEKRLNLVKQDLKVAEEDLKAFAQKNKIVQVDSQASASITAISRIRAEIASREVQLAILRRSRTDQSPEVLALQTGITRLRGELGALVGTDTGGEGVPSLGNVPGLGLEYSRKMREFKTQEAIYEQLTKQYEIAKLNEAKDSSTLQVLDAAVVPIKKSRPVRSIIVLSAAAASFFISILFILVQEYLTNVSDEDKIILQYIKKHTFAIR